MKRLLVFLLAILAMSTGLRAQTKEAKPWLHSGLTISAGPGMFKFTPHERYGPHLNGGFACTADIGYRLNLAKGFSWQVVKGSATYGFNEKRRVFAAYSGLRYDTPRLPIMYNWSLFGAFDAGVAHANVSIPYYTYDNYTPFAWDACLGIKFHSNVSAAIVVKSSYGELIGPTGNHYGKFNSLLGSIQFEYIF